MSYVIPIEDKLKSEAEFGLFFAKENITKKKAEELRLRGFIVTDLGTKKGFPRLHKIDWGQAGLGVFDYMDIKKLDPNDAKYSLSQRLWLISAQNNRKIKKQNEGA